MNLNKTQIRIAATFYDARDAARSILGEEGFRERMEKETEFIRSVMETNKCEAIPAAMWIVTTLQKNERRRSGVAQMMVLAACVEMLEPTITETSPNQTKLCPI